MCLVWSVLAGARTLDPLIKSQLLYQLSYEDLRLQRYKKIPYHLWFWAFFFNEKQ